ncbi:hypothetical protein B0F90DRAFT_1668163 [Multifurca ochricompacta]|uniref:Uncharacterized protein n=1 Tax=Multifurca ochricompacta TaxID=376703 RepID=A0AAD4QNN8_9AGAM|nr:hypothetical protein B0F90DRAFT_1668163 [Multifurca ochricompacta]
MMKQVLHDLLRLQKRSPAKRFLSESLGQVLHQYCGRAGRRNKCSDSGLVGHIHVKCNPAYKSSNSTRLSDQVHRTRKVANAKNEDADIELVDDNLSDEEHENLVQEREIQGSRCCCEEGHGFIYALLALTLEYLDDIEPKDHMQQTSTSVGGVPVYSELEKGSFVEECPEKLAKEFKDSNDYSKEYFQGVRDEFRTPSKQEREGKNSIAAQIYNQIHPVTWKGGRGQMFKSPRLSIVILATEKLMDGHTALDNTTICRTGSSACVSVHLSLEFNLANTHGREVARTHVERPMRLCLAATTGLESMITVAGSELCLAEAARRIMNGSAANRLAAWQSIGT